MKFVLKPVGTPFITYREDLIVHFRELDPSGHREIIHFYELHKQQLRDLDIDVYLEIELGYTHALFELGKYEPFLVRTKYLLETLIYHNVKYLNGEDAYEKLLLRKAAAHFHLLELSTAETVLWQILKMNPHNQTAAYLLKKCLLRETPKYLNRLQGFCIFLFLLSATIIAVELLVIHPFYQQFRTVVAPSKIIIFVFALALLVFGQLFHRLRSFHIVNRRIWHLKRGISQHS